MWSIYLLSQDTYIKLQVVYILFSDHWGLCSCATKTCTMSINGVQGKGGELTTSDLNQETDKYTFWQCQHNSQKEWEDFIPS